MGRAISNKTACGMPLRRLMINDEYMADSSNYIPSQIEREAFLWLQGRMVELLMHYDVSRFNTKFVRLNASPEDTGNQWLEPYRRLAVLYYLRSALFDHILPRIKNRLSAVAPHQFQKENIPARGRIDWTRTAAANWRERPGEVPLEVHTSRRYRHFATPENLLTVVTLLEYQQTAQMILDEKPALEAVRHPLQIIVESCRRELAFPQFAGLISQSREISEGYGSVTVAELEQKTQAGLAPGGNSAYHDLLEWRRQLDELKLRDRVLSPSSAPMLGNPFKSGGGF
jgi:hypothetical protein